MVAYEGFKILLYFFIGFIPIILTFFTIYKISEEKHWNKVGFTSFVIFYESCIVEMLIFFLLAFVSFINLLVYIFNKLGIV